MRKPVIVSPGSGERLGCPNDYHLAAHLYLLSVTIHSRIYAGQFSNFIPPASQTSRNFTTDRSTSFTSVKSITMLWSSASALKSFCNSVNS